MARAYSHDLRTRVLDAVRAGLSRRAAAARYRVGIATVIRWAAHAAATGQTRPQRHSRTIAASVWAAFQISTPAFARCADTLSGIPESSMTGP